MNSYGKYRESQLDMFDNGDDFFVDQSDRDEFGNDEKCWSVEWYVLEYFFRGFFHSPHDLQRL